MTGSNSAVFISYASDDRASAQKICDALRDAGVEVWFDQGELRGGDAWDNKIRTQIKSCSLFLVVISRNASARDEGYFRLEWKLAIDRSHHMSGTRSFIVPVAIDDTPESTASLPDRFRDFQWTRLPQGEASAPFAQHVRRLLTHDKSVESADRIETTSPLTASSGWRRSGLLWAASALTLVAVAIWGVGSFRTKPGLNGTQAAKIPITPEVSDFKPPEHSVAVLPFANLSGDSSQEYFSDGLSEEILDALSRLADIRVAARSASFSFKGKNDSVADMGHRLNVGAILEGSVRRSGSHVRISARLIESATGFELWAQSYDREMKDILALQTDIATAVTQNLKVTLSQSVAGAVEEGGTHNPLALDKFLKLSATDATREGVEAGVKIASEAIRLDPTYAKAYIARSLNESALAGVFDPQERVQSRYAEARADIETALRLIPESALAHAAYSSLLTLLLDFPGAVREAALARKLAPTAIYSPQIKLSSMLAQHRQAIDESLRAINKDPMIALVYEDAAYAYYYAGDLDRALQEAEHVKSIDAEFAKQSLCRISYAVHRYQQVIDGCPESDDADVMVSRTLALDALNRKRDADLQLQNMMATNGDTGAYQYAEVYAQRGEIEQALHWVEKAYKLRDGGLAHLQVDPYLNSLRREPRYQAVLRMMKFPPSW